MTTFKDLLSEQQKSTIKQMGDQATIKAYPQEAHGQPSSQSLMSPKDISATVKRLGSDLINNDKVMFLQAMAGVRPLKHEKRIETLKPSDAKTDANTLFRRANAQGTDPQSQDSLSDMQALLNPVASEAVLSYKIPSLQTRVFEQLKQGKLRWYDAVDLHGSSIEEARTAVLTLIANARHQGDTVVKIVHGKGNDAILKTCVNGWLRQLPNVLAFVSAPIKDGGTGAVLVLLKRQKDNNA